MSRLVVGTGVSETARTTMLGSAPVAQARDPGQRLLISVLPGAAASPTFARPIPRSQAWRSRARDGLKPAVGSGGRLDVDVDLGELVHYLLHRRPIGGQLLPARGDDVGEALERLAQLRAREKMAKRVRREGGGRRGLK
eukprot:2985369-Pleurochrysis_carterae.AAC.2